mgnify:CR=1 FL=1
MELPDDSGYDFDFIVVISPIPVEIELLCSNEELAPSTPSELTEIPEVVKVFLEYVLDGNWSEVVISKELGISENDVCSIVVTIGLELSEELTIVTDSWELYVEITFVLSDSSVSADW